MRLILAAAFALGLANPAVALDSSAGDLRVEPVVTGLDESYEAAQQLFQNAPPPPDDPRVTGSAASLIDWAAMWTYRFGVGLRTLQTGNLRQYVMLIVVGTVALFALVSLYWRYSGGF